MKKKKKETKRISEKMIEKEHLEDLKKSGLSDETIQQAGIYSISIEEFQKKISKKIIKASSAYAIPYSKEYERYRCFYPKGIKGPKYRQKKGTLPKPYIPNSVKEILHKNNVPLWITEGEKKSLCLTQHDCPAIAVSGIWNFKAGKNSLTDLEDKTLWEELRKIIWRGREIYLAFDADLWINPQVRDALYELAFTLYELKANIKFISWDVSQGKGIDDFIVYQENNRKEAKKVIPELKKESKDLFSFMCREHQESIFRALRKVKLSPIKQTEIVKCLTRILNTKEQLVWGEIAHEKEKKPDYTEEEIDTATELLKSSNLVEKFLEVCHKDYLGRDKELIAVKLATISRHFNKGVPIVITGTSSVGKSGLIEIILKTVHAPDKHDFSYISSKFLAYLKEDLDHKIITFFEIHGADKSIQLIRTALSEGVLNLGTVVDDKKVGLTTKEIKKSCTGLVILSTFASAKIDHEFATRVIKFEIEYDEILARKILLHKSRQDLISNNNDIFKIWQAADKLITPKEIYIPYIELLSTKFHLQEERSIRDFDKVKSLISASALWHQYQRETKNEKIVATIEDYKLIYKLRYLLQQSSSDVSTPVEKFLEATKLLMNKKEKHFDRVYREDIQKYLNVSSATIKRYIKIAEKAECISVNGIGQKQTIKVYDIPKTSSPLPSPDELFNESVEPLSQTVESASSTQDEDDQPQKSQLEPSLTAQTESKRIKLPHLTKKKVLKTNSSMAQTKS